MLGNGLSKILTTTKLESSERFTMDYIKQPNHKAFLAILILADYQYKSAFVADQEINMTACLTEIMVECEFK